MVIWCISKYALPPEYGAQHRLFMLSKYFNENHLKSYVITCSTSHLAKLPPQQKTFRISQVNGSTTIFIKSLKVSKSTSWKRVVSWFIFEINLFRFILIRNKKKIESPDIVLVSSLSLLTILNGIFIKKKYNAKFVFEIRDIWPLTAILISKKSRYNPFIIFMSWVEKLGYKYADLITSPLANLPEHVKKTINKDITNFLYVPQGHITPVFDKNDHLEKGFIEKYIPANKFIIGYIGNIVEAYDLITLINCAKKLDKHNQRIHFIILGDGNFKKSLINLSASLSNVSFAPRIQKSKIPDFLSYCHVATNFLKPEPLFKYGVSPQKLIDYMLASKPVVMSYTGYPSIVTESACGYEIEAGNIELLSKKFIELSEMEPSELLKIGERGKSFLEHNLHWEKISNTYIESFKKLSQI